MKIVYRERPEYIYEHVAIVDGKHLKIHGNNLLMRCHNQSAKLHSGIGAEVPVLNIFHVWENLGPCWEIDTTDRTPGVYKREDERAAA